MAAQNTRNFRDGKSVMSIQCHFTLLCIVSPIEAAHPDEHSTSLVTAHIDRSHDLDSIKSLLLDSSLTILFEQEFFFCTMK